MPKRVYAAGDEVETPFSAFSKDGFVFVGWATEPDGPVVYGETIEGGIDAANGATVTLYARWAQSQYAVHFNANGGEGTMVDESFWIGIPGGLSSNAFARTGYAFAGWANTEGGEIAFADRALVTNLTETANATANLYAVWEPHQYSVCFNHGAGTGSMPSQQLTYDVETNLTPNAFTCTGYTFAGWATEADGAKVYDDGDAVVNLSSANNAVIDLYAIWTANEYTVKFDANCGTGTMSDLAFTYDQAATLTANAFARANRFFAGWATAADGAVVFADGEEVSNLTAEANGEVTLYAVWADSRVVFDANGGEGTMDPFYMFAGTEQTLPSSSFSKDGHFLLGWAFSPDGEATLLDGDSTTEIAVGQGETITLHAVWYEGEGRERGLSVEYYDISSSGYSTWTQSEAAMLDYFVSMTPTIETNTLAWGEGLDAGFSNSIGSDGDNWVAAGMTRPNSSCLFHSNYRNSAKSNFAAFITGFLNITDSGDYEFAVVADDAVVLYIDGERLLENGANWGNMATGTTALSAGVHVISIGFYEASGGQGLSVQWKTPGNSSYSPIPQSVVSHGGNSIYAIRFDANGGEGSMPKRVYAAGDDVALPEMDFIREGYTFAGWATSADGPIAYADGEIVEGGLDAVDGEAITLYARWSPNEYAVAFDPTGGTFAGNLPTNMVIFDSPYGELPVVERTGYTFAGWTLDGEAVTAESVCTTPSNHVLTATWAPNEYTVSFDALGGTVSPGQKTVTFDAAYGELPMPSCDGYVFLDWRLSGAAVDAATVMRTPGSHTLSARWGVAVGNGVWEESIGDEPIALGAPEIAPSGVVVIPSEIAGRPVVAIGADAFAGNTAITSVTIPTNVPELVEGCFAGCTGLREVVIPLSVTNIAENAFAGCTGIRRISVGSLYGHETLQDLLSKIMPDAKCAEIECVSFLDGVTIIPDNFFEGCTALRAMDIAESVAEIGTNVFEACSALATTTVGGLEMYQGWCLGFAGGSLGELAPPDLAIPEEYEDETARPEGSPHHGTPYRVRGIAAGAFSGEWEISTLALPDSLRFIGAGAFEDCTGLEDVILPEGVAKIDRDAFRNCTYAQGLALPESLRTIGDGAFGNCSMLMGVELPQGVREVGAGAFSNCWRAVSVSIPQSVESVGEGAFADCRRVVGVTVPLHIAPMETLFPAAFAQVETVAVADLDGSLGDLAPPEAEAWLASRQMVPDAFKGCAAVEGIVLPEWVANIPDGAFENCTALTTVSVPDGVTNIAAQAFANDAALASFAFPTGLVSIGESAFSGCSGIGSLALPEGLEGIGARAFEGLALLARADIPATVREIGDGAFGGCTAIRAVTIPGDAGTLSAAFPDAYAGIVSATVVAEVDGEGDPARPEGSPHLLMDALFAGCTALSSVELPPNLGLIGADAFRGCTALAQVGIPAAVTNIGARAFADCATLSSVALPKSLVTLKTGAFSGCAALAEITVPESVGTLEHGVFDGCDRLLRVNYVGDAPAYSTADGGPYAGIAAGAISYVENGSTGWDGIATSKALPEYWPDGTTHEIAFWTPNRFTVSFDPNWGGETATAVEQVTGTSCALPADPVRQGARFAGWWTAPENGARVTASSQVTATRPYSVYAHWTMNRYTVHFDANGGSGEVEPLAMTVGTAAALPQCPFSRVAYAFAGWATAPDGEAVYADGAEVQDLAWANNAAVTLYAVWVVRDWTVADYLDAPGLDFEVDGGAEWSPDWTDFRQGGASYTSGYLPPSETEGAWNSTTLRTTVVGAGSFSFWWRVSCEEMDVEYGDWYDFATFSVDGVEVERIAGESGWLKVECAVEGAGEHVLEWAFWRDDYDEDDAAWDNALWVDGIEWTPAEVALFFDAGGAYGDVPDSVIRYEGYGYVLPGAGSLTKGEYVFMGWSDGETTYAVGDTYTFGSSDATLTAVWELHTWTLAEAVDAGQLEFTTGGNADWKVDATEGWTNGVSAKSGDVASGESSWIEATVSGTGTFSFRWKVMGGNYRNKPFAYATVAVDGGEAATTTYLTDGWEEQTFVFEDDGAHTIRWIYQRTSERSCDGDCAWLDAVHWTPDAAEEPTVIEISSISVPTTWIGKDAETFFAAAEAAGKRGEEAMRAALEMTAANGRPVWECYVADLDPTDPEDDLKVTIEMKSDGTPEVLILKGEKATRAYVTQGAPTPSGPWDVPDGNSQFFRVKVTVPEQ